MTFQAWAIYLFGLWLDTVFLDAISDSGDPDAAETVRQSLIAQGYDPAIKVRLWRSISLHGNFAVCRSLTGRQDEAH